MLTRNHLYKGVYVMSSIPQNHFDENDSIDCVQRFFQTLHHQTSCQMQRNERNKRACTNLSVFTINAYCEA